jgi:hypothetical protein
MKKSIKITKIFIPPYSMIAKAYKKYDYADSYLFNFHSADPISVDDITKKMFLDLPEWVIFLLDMRNIIVKYFGLKVGDIKEIINKFRNNKIETGKPFLLFNVLDKNEKEIMMGEDDKHLNFKLSIILEKNGNNYTIIVTTVVVYNNIFGNLYFLPVKPFHKLIVKTMIKNIVRKHYNEKNN